MQDSPLPEPEIDTFLDLVDGYGRLWDSFSIGVVAIRAGEDLVVRTAFVKLHIRGSARPSSKRSLPRTSRILAIHKTWPIGRFREFVDEVRTGAITIGDDVLRIAEKAAPAEADKPLGPSNRLVFEGLRHWNVHRNGPFSAQGAPLPLVTGHRLYAQGWQSGSEFYRLVDGGIEAINDELSGRKYNWHSLKHVIDASESTFTGWSPDHTTVFNVFAPLGIVLNTERCELRDGSLLLSFFAASKTVVRMASVGVSGMSEDGERIDEEITLAKQTWHESDDLWTSEVTLSVPRTAGLAVVLRVNDSTVQTLPLEAVSADGNPLQIVHALEHKKSDDSWRDYLLNTQATNAPQFAAAVARLFTGLGLPVIHLPEDNAANVDSLVGFGRNHILLIESTTSHWGDKKVGNLLQRTNSIRTGLRDRGFEVSETYVEPLAPEVFFLNLRRRDRRIFVVPIFAVSVPSNDVPPSRLKEAHAAGIAVFARDDLRHLLKLSDSGEDVGRPLRELIAGRLKHSLG